MENQENTSNMSFADTELGQPIAVNSDGKGDDVVIKVGGSGSGKGWMIAAIAAIVVVVGLAAGLTFALLSVSDSKRKVDEMQVSLDSTTSELNRFKEVTGVENPEDVVMGDGGVDVDFSSIAKLLNNAFVYLDGSFLRYNGDFQVAKFNVSDAGGSGYVAYLYRALPDGQWRYSSFSGQGAPSCDDVTDEEVDAFEGIIECGE
jgi:hypothetical protein